MQHSYYENIRGLYKNNYFVPLNKTAHKCTDSITKAF